MPTESEIIEIRVRAALNIYSNMDPLNTALAARLHGAPPDHVYQRLKGIQSKIERKGSNRKLSNHQKAIYLAYIDHIIQYIGYWKFYINIAVFCYFI